MTDPARAADVHQKTGIWPLIHAERAALAADLTDLTDEQWATSSLCTGFDSAVRCWRTSPAEPP